MRIEARIEQLERRCRILSISLVASFVIAGLLLFAGAANQKDQPTLRAQQLDIVDADGNVRIRIGKVDEGFGVVVSDNQQKPRATLTTLPKGLQCL